MPKKRHKQSGSRTAEPTASDALVADVDAWLKNNQVEKAARYVRAGRRHGSMADAELRDAWCVAFRAMAANLHDEHLRRAEQDLLSELELRNQLPPYDLVKGDFDRLIAAVSQAYDALKADPEGFAQANRDMTLDLNKFKLERDRPKN
jgi:hypothetical protein